MPKTLRVSFVNSAPWLEELKGHLPYEFTHDNPDVIIGWSVIQMGQTIEQVRKYPDAKLIMYNWDVYSWVWSRPRPGEYDYRRYGELLKQAHEVWVPSEAEQARTKKWFDLKSIVIPTFVPVFEAETTQGNYVLNPLRQLPDDHDTWFERACEELSIPYISNGHHSYDYEEYKKVIAGCRFLCSPYHDTSTGGLDLMKGYHLGKPSLVYEGSGARTYLGDNAVYFSDFNDLRRKLRQMYDNPPTFTEKLDFSVETMAQRIKERLDEAHTGASTSPRREDR